MKKGLIYLSILFLLLSCTKNRGIKIVESSHLFPPALMVELDTIIGYKLNSFSGDVIKPLINSNGDTIISGKEIAAIGKQINPEEVRQPKQISPLKPFQTKFARQTKKVSEPLHRILVDINEFETLKVDSETNASVLKNSVGDKVLTGIEFNFTGKIVPARKPVSYLALSPKQKERNMLNIKYIDVEQGMNSSYVLAILEDRNHNIWFGTKDGGVSIYDGITFNVFTEKEGLVNNDVKALCEDKNGNIWLGTAGGVCKYDGKTFTHFTEAEGLINNQILFIYEDSKNNLWFGTNGGGVCKYNGKTFVNYTTNEGLTSNIVRYIMEDSQGRIWFGTNGGGITILHNNRFLSFTTEDGLPSNSVLPIMEDSKGNFWIGTWGSGVCKYDGTHLTTYTEEEGLIYNSINSIVEDENGKILFGTWEGVSIYNGSSFVNLTEEQGLSYRDINVILQDHTGNFWMGTWGGGVNIYTDNLFTSFTEVQGLNDYHIFSMLEDSNRNIWFGSWKGVSRLRENVLTHYTETQGLGDNYVYAAFEDSKHNYWFGTGEGGVTKYDGISYVHYTTEQGLCENYINSICEDNDGNLWFASQNEGVSKLSNGRFTQYTEEDGLSSNSVNCVIKDHMGNLWFGTNDGGITRFNGETFLHFTEKEGLSNNSVLSVFEDSQNNLWIGTDGGGLCMFNGEQFFCYSTREGLSDNSVRSIIEDGNKNIWASTQKGVNLIFVSSKAKYGNSGLLSKEKGLEEVEFDYSHPKIHIYNEMDGITGIDFYKNSVLLDSDNRIWWGGGKSLTMLDLNNFKLNENAPGVHLNRVEINEEFIENEGSRSEKIDIIHTEQTSKTLRFKHNEPLSYLQNHLTFYFSGIDWSAPHKIRYSYKLEGLNKNWSNPSPEYKADYRNLPPGNYTFQLRAIGDAQIWSIPVEYSFVILPPWWNTLLARSVFVFFLIMLVFGVVRWRTYKLNLHKTQLQRIIKERDLQIEKAKESDRLKSAFLANMSHEIRTPMNGILGFAELLKEPGLSGEVQQNYISIIEKSGARMLNIINDIISISKIESGQVELYIQETDIIEQMQYIYTFFKPEIEQKGIRFLFQKKQHDEKLIVKTDREKVYSILTNLVKNAVKYTSHGTIELGYNLYEKFLQIYVQDTGCGIPKNRQEAIFERFIQADISDKMALQGAGLGLSISKAYVEMLGGSIAVESAENQGSTFSFTLPYQDYLPISQSLDKEIQPVVSDKLEHKLKILIAEDDEISEILLSNAIKEFKKEILKVKTGIDAVEVCRRNPDIDLILMDVQMPEMNGYEATKEIRKFNKDVKIIIQTAYALEGDNEKAFKAGSTDYLSKPVRAAELKKTILKYFS